MSAANTTVWYAIVDRAHNIVDGAARLKLSESVVIIEDLKEKIGERDDYRHADTADFRVYQSPLNVAAAKEDGFQAKVSAFLNDSKPLRLWSWEAISSWIQPADVRCILVDPKNHVAGAVMKVSAASVSDLRCRVKDERSNDLRHVDAPDLVVWRFKPQLRTSTEPEIIDFNDAIKLTGDPSLRGLGLADEETLIVQIPCTHPLLEKAILLLREEQLQAHLPPSELTSEGVERLQQVPVTLFHPILNEFNHDCQNYTPRVEDYRFALELSTLSRFYFSKEERQNAFLEACNNHGLQIESQSIPGTSYHTGGSILSNKWPCLIVGLKNEVGSTGAEPVFQTAAYYRAYLKSQKVGQLQPNLTFPCIGLYMVGPLMGFFGMVFTTRINLQMLGQQVRLDFHQTDDTQRTLLARHLGALRVAVKKLEALYNGESHMTMQVQIEWNSKIFFPAYCYFDSIDPVDQVERRVKYMSQPSDKLRVFCGKCDGEEVLIKFVKRYSLEVHRFCAEKDLAPRLLGSRLLLGGWTMVVMERLDESWKMASDCTKTEELFKEINKALVEIHQADYVHGDVCDSNIMVKKVDRRYSIKLVDFDWAGKIGDTGYPQNVEDQIHLRRPNGVFDGELIKSEHDMDMLDYTFREVVSPRNGHWWNKKPVEDVDNDSEAWLYL